jgi:hypothetical protein
MSKPQTTGTFIAPTQEPVEQKQWSPDAHSIASNAFKEIRCPKGKEMSTLAAQTLPKLQQDLSKSSAIMNNILTDHKALTKRIFDI